MADEKTPGVLPSEKKEVARKRGSAPIIDISASLEKRAVPLSEDDLRTAIARIVMYGTFVESRHSAQARSYRNVSERDIVAMLEGKWSLDASPEWDAAHRNWKYRLKGADMDGDELVLIVTVDVELNRIDIITKF